MWHATWLYRGENIRGGPNTAKHGCRGLVCSKAVGWVLDDDQLASGSMKRCERRRATRGAVDYCKAVLRLIKASESTPRRGPSEAGEGQAGGPIDAVTGGCRGRGSGMN